MFKKKSYSESDVYSLAMEWREIEDSAECGTPSGGLAEWTKIGNNKSKLFKNFGIQHGFIKGKFKGKPEDFDEFLKEVVIKAHNHGLGLNFGKSIYKEHKSLIKKMDEEYFSGIKLGVDQALTDTPHYQDYQKEIFGPNGILIPAKEYEDEGDEDEGDEDEAKNSTNSIIDKLIEFRDLPDKVTERGEKILGQDTVEARDEKEDGGALEVTDTELAKADEGNNEDKENEDKEKDEGIESFYKNKTDPFMLFVYFFLFIVILFMSIGIFDTLIFGY